MPGTNRYCSKLASTWPVQPVFFPIQNRGVIRTNLLASTVYSDRTSRYGTELTPLVSSREICFMHATPATNLHFLQIKNFFYIKFHQINFSKRNKILPDLQDIAIFSSNSQLFSLFRHCSS